MRWEAIAAVDRSWGIGYRGELLVHLPPDLARFRALTLGRTVILGRRTLETLPNRRPLPGRRNLILSRTEGFQAEGAEVFSSIESLCAACPADAVVIGGQSVYEALLPRCVRVHLTRIDSGFPADAWFPRLDNRTGWERTWKSEAEEYGGVRFWYEQWDIQKVR